MNCEECQSLAEEYFDRELGPEIANEVAIHVETCASCSLVLKQLSAELNAYQKYERDVEVSPALWASVELRLLDKGKTQDESWFSSLLVELLKPFAGRARLATSFALVLFVVLATFVGTKYLNREKQLPGQAEVSATASPRVENLGGQSAVKPSTLVDRPTSSKGGNGNVAAAGIPKLKSRASSLGGAERGAGNLTQVVRNAEKKYLSAIAVMTRDAQRRSVRLDSKDQARLNDALMALDRTILSTRKVVQQNPDDALAVQYMLSAYGKKVDVLREMGRY
jgi:putative zinc finger protein